jgi:hypothetical protein
MTQTRSVGVFLEQFLDPWCVVLAKMPDDVEKESALKGLFSLCQAQPNVILKHVVRVALAVVSFSEPTDVLRNSFNQFFTMIRKAMPPQQWDTEFEKTPQIRLLLGQRYGVQ